jgi:hypothetical protein
VSAGARPGSGIATSDGNISLDSGYLFNTDAHSSGGSAAADAGANADVNDYTDEGEEFNEGRSSAGSSGGTGNTSLSGSLSTDGHVSLHATASSTDLAAATSTDELGASGDSESGSWASVSAGAASGWPGYTTPSDLEQTTSSEALANIDNDSGSVSLTADGSGVFGGSPIDAGGWSFIADRATSSFGAHIDGVSGNIYNRHPRDNPSATLSLTAQNDSGGIQPGTEDSTQCTLDGSVTDWDGLVASADANNANVPNMDEDPPGNIHGDMTLGVNGTNPETDPAQQHAEGSILGHTDGNGIDATQSTGALTASKGGKGTAATNGMVELSPL